MNIRPFYVAPVLPPRLKPLQEIAMNIWYSWNWEAVRLFIMIDQELWEHAYQNPVAMLGRVPQSRFQELAEDDGFVAHVERVHMSLKNYKSSLKWFEEKHGDKKDMLTAYFSCEFGLDEGLPVYSGGLGVLAGDHLKAASDMGIPLVGVGLLYRQGYFRQRLNADGWQLEEYPENDWYNMPVSIVNDENGKPITISVNLGSMTIHSQIWKVEVGNVNLYLLDTNFDANPPNVREITTQLYGGDRDMRLRQELLLGIGGIKALQKLGIEPSVYHINEGHSAFQILERIAGLIETQGLNFKEAREAVWGTNIFTTHTPVPAGNEQFDPELLKKYLESTIKRLHISWDDFIRMGRVNPDDTSELFGMTVFALHNAAYSNGVSRLHGHVSRGMWQGVWKNLRDVNEVPISHVTNGIHTRSWLSHEMGELLESYLGTRFTQKPWEYDVWNSVDRIPDIELWRTHQRRREKLVFFARQRLKAQLERRGAQPGEMQIAEEVLSPHAFTIGFARRFATYKRANLLFSDLERLKRIVLNSDCPVQVIIAGKAHPQDHPAKELIRQLIHNMRDTPFRNTFVFIEDYDINVARYLVQGCDIWLNTPRRPLEASGTSGMKAALNGVLNVSILDGWWDEGFSTDVGWAIGSAAESVDVETKDSVEAQALYDCLEHDVIPTFYNRDNSELPREWIAKMKNSIRELGPEFGTHRMLEDYTDQLYIPAHESSQVLLGNQYENSRQLASWRDSISQSWDQVHIVEVNTLNDSGDLNVGDSMTISAKVNLGRLNPDDVSLELVTGRLDSEGKFAESSIIRTDYKGGSGEVHTFEGQLQCVQSGRHGYTVRVRPKNPQLIRMYSPDFVTWG